ncbi:MAG TPA: cellulase family glycosylhydrolase [Solirubrobacteraceae bacterium]|nr:cellulase family glycosylhydrolase [Solirubrobacteraceae bacterium]
MAVALMLCLGALAAIASLACASPLPGVNLGGFGPQPSHVDEEMAKARGLHSKLVRIEVTWSDFEPNASGQIEPSALALTDRIVTAAKADGIRVIMLVDGTPCWASSAPDSLLSKCVPGRSSEANSWPPAQPSAYAAFVAFLAKRYGAGLAGIEVWNEPDQANELYFAGPHKAQHYAELLRAAYPAIKQADPSVPVLGGSLVGSNGVFLRALYAAGIKGYYDGLAVHFYTLTLAALREIHQVQLANGDRTPLWLDEFGWSSCWPAKRIQQEQACVTAKTQARNFSDLFHSLARTSYVAAAVFFKLRDSSDENFGVLNARGAHKLSFGTVSRLFSSPFGRPSPVTLKLFSRRGQVIASGSGPVGDYMQLEVLQHGVPRFRALFGLDRFNRYSLTLPRVLGRHGLKVKVWQSWSGVGAAATKRI